MTIMLMTLIHLEDDYYVNDFIHLEDDYNVNDLIHLEDDHDVCQIIPSNTGRPE